MITALYSVIITVSALFCVLFFAREPFADWLIRRALQREPGLVIGPRENPYMHRYFEIPKNRVFNIFLHRIMRNDDDRAVHDHPWWSIGWVIRGYYFDIVPKHPKNFDGTGPLTAICRDLWSLTFRRATAAHRIVLPGMTKKREAWTLFFTGPEIRVWGFWCPSGWRSSHDFAEKRDGESVVGRGCE